MEYRSKILICIEENVKLSAAIKSLRRQESSDMIDSHPDISGFPPRRQQSWIPAYAGMTTAILGINLYPLIYRCEIKAGFFHSLFSNFFPEFTV